jgi:hypothetical protein
MVIFASPKSCGGGWKDAVSGGRKARTVEGLFMAGKQHKIR